MLRFLPAPIRRFLALSAALTGLCLLTELVCAFVLHLPPVYKSPLFIGLSFFDFECYHQCFAYLHTVHFFGLEHTWPWAYPAPVAVLFAFFFAFKADPLNLFLASVAIIVTIMSVLFVRAGVRRGLDWRSATSLTLALLLLSYPLAFTFERANMEFYIFFLLALGVWAFVTGRNWLAALCFGLAGSMKIFPIVYLGLFLPRRQYRPFAAGFLVAGLSTLLSLWFVGPTVPIAWRGIQDGVEIFRQAFLLRPRPAEFAYDHSLFGFYRRFATLPPPQQLAHDLSFYLASAALLGTALFFFRIRRLPVINQVLALAIAAILLPPASFDYTLIHLYVPLALILLTIIQSPALSPRGLMPILVSLSLLVSAESELIWHGDRVAAQLKCVVLVVLFAQALLYPLASEYDQGVCIR